MKIFIHGSGLSHADVVRFSNRLARQASSSLSPVTDLEIGFERGWNAASQYFAHELRKKLREIEFGH